MTRGRALIRIIVGLLLGFCVIAIAGAITMVLTQTLLADLVKTHAWLSQFTTTTSVLILSILLILMLSKGKMATYGFTLPVNMRLLWIVVIGLVLGFISTLLANVLPSKGLTFVEEFTFLQTVVLVWIYASIGEEILTRGLVQSYLSPLLKNGFTVFGSFISIPVLLSALFFGFMHLPLLTLGIDISTVSIIVVFACMVGIAAGYFREKTGSLVPAILVHMFANIGGSICDMLFY
jgi:membrane protease YdiL (CAAX protease family)